MGESIELYNEFQQSTWLYQRLLAAASEPEASFEPSQAAQVNTELHELEAKLHVAASRKARANIQARLADLAQALMPHARPAYSSVRDDLSNARAAKLPTDEIEKRLSLFRSVLEREDWVARKQEVREALKRTLSELKSFGETMSHDKLCFKDPAHRDTEIRRFEEAFNPAERHAKFEEGIERFQRVSALAKDFLGCEKFVEDDLSRQLLESIGTQILQTVMVQRGMICMPLETNYQQTENGVKFQWKVVVAPLGQQMVMEREVPLDRSDVDAAKLNREFLILHHEVQERIRGLSDCATEADLASQLSEFNMQPQDSAVGEICVICQEEMEAGEEALRINSCGHCFHSECVKGWLLGCKHECPTCKAPVDAAAAITPEAVLFTEGTAVVIDGLQSRAELNGTVGQIVSFSEARGRYNVQTANGCLSVHPKNLTTQAVEVDDLDEELRAALALSLEQDLSQVELRYEQQL